MQYILKNERGMPVMVDMSLRQLLDTVADTYDMELPDAMEYIKSIGYSIARQTATTYNLSSEEEEYVKTIVEDAKKLAVASENSVWSDTEDEELIEVLEEDPVPMPDNLNDDEDDE